MNREWDDPEESRRFLETTNEVEMSDDPKDFDRALKKVAPHREKYSANPSCKTLLCASSVH